MVIKEYSILPNASRLEPHCQMLFNVISRTRVAGVGSYPSAKTQSMFYSPSQLD